LDYISLTDIARYRNTQEPFAVINNWMRNRNTLDFVGLWERLNHPDFKPLEFERIKKRGGKPVLCSLAATLDRDDAGDRDYFEIRTLRGIKKNH